MGKVEEALKSEIARLARKEIRASQGALLAELRRQKKRASQLSQSVTALTRKVNALSTAVKTQAAEATSAEQAKTSRLSPGLIKKLRLRLGISQAQLARLINVSTVAIQFWESGRTKPNEANRAAIVALRKYGRRDVRQRLPEKKSKTASGKKSATKKSAAKKSATKKSAAKRSATKKSAAKKSAAKKAAGKKRAAKKRAARKAR